jgi:alpha-tubulin suppressor-like RCC1 family protein
VTGGYFITQDGGMFGWGRDNLAKNHRKHVYDYDSNSNGTITPIYGGVQHMDDDIYVTSKGEVYVWDHHDRIGGDFNEDAFHPFWPAAKVPNLPSNIVQVARTSHAMLALSEDGLVYGWGKNHEGALLKGEDNDITEKVPTQLPFPEKISDIIVENGNKRFAIGGIWKCVFMGEYSRIRWI